MIDGFEVVTSSGVVLWSKEYTKVPHSLVENLIRDVFIERKDSQSSTGNAETVVPSPSYYLNGYTLRWAVAKNLGLVFVATYQSRLHVPWIDRLLKDSRTLFIEKYKDQLTPTKLASTTQFNCDFDRYFNIQISRLEPSLTTEAPALSKSLQPELSVETDEPSEEEAERPDENKSAILSVPKNDTAVLKDSATAPGRKSRRARKAAAAAASTGVKPSAPPVKQKKGKQKRKWTENGIEEDSDSDVVLDYSKSMGKQPAELGTRHVNTETVPQANWGKRTNQGEFLVRDLEEVDSILASVGDSQEIDAEERKTLFGSGLSALSGMIRNVVGGKTLDKEELGKALKTMEDQLIKKNVAREAAAKLCSTIEQELIGFKTASFTSVETTLRAAMEKALHQILTPTTSLDLLREVNSVTSPSTGDPSPYVISIVGVNGVGKSTNLSKLAYFFLQNQYRVLIVAADTFRSGAVEQLGVHVRNLKELVDRDLSSSAKVELYQKGYGTNAAQVAAEAVDYAKENGWQVVLIDTAGRRHNDTRLMSNLHQFAVQAKPHKIFMVGEALVGSDSVQQARNFDEAFSKGRGISRASGRHLDGFIISKCDTVGEMVGVLVSMVHATGIPIVFLGVGQHYTDLRTLSVPWAVKMLMQ